MFSKKFSELSAFQKSYVRTQLLNRGNFYLVKRIINFHIIPIGVQCIADTEKNSNHHGIKINCGHVLIVTKIDIQPQNRNRHEI